VTEPVPAAGDPAKVPAPTAPWAPGTSRPLDPEALAQWTARLDRGEHFCKQFHPQWERGLTRYAKALANETPTDINALLDYRHVESKKSKLFHRTPDVTLTPVDPQDPGAPLAAILPLRQKLLNHEIGPKGANAKRALHKTLLDTLAASGLMICVVGYEDVQLDVPPDPLTGAPAPLPKITVWSRRFISALSSKKLITPDDFTDSSDFDAASWLAYKGTMPASQARRMGWAIPDDVTGSTQRDDALYKHGTTADGGGADPQLEYTIVWYRAALYDPAVFHPELYRCLVLVKGVEQPAWHIDSPFQSLTPQGQLTDDSLIGNPIHVGTLRDLLDSAFVPSDLVMGEQLSVELNKFRGDLIRNRAARRPRIVTAEGLGGPVIEKLAKNEGPVSVPDHYIDGAGQQKALSVVQAGSEPRDNFTAQDVIERDYEEAFGEGANQRGQTSKRKTTATEARIVQGNSSARAETEKDRIRDYFVALVRKYDAIVQRTATQQDVAKVLGQQGAALWEQWKALPGTYAYDIVPDSGRYTDAREAASQALDEYQLLRKDERVSTEYLLSRLARGLQADPAQLIAPPKDKTTEPPSASLNFKGEDTLNPAMGNLLLDILANAGIKLRPETIATFAAQHAQAMAMGQGGAPAIGMNADPNQHGGTASVTEPINQHQMEKTGRVQGSVQ
jgi:hypothetical protein